MTHTNKMKAAYARENPTVAESRLWQHIKGLQTGARFTRKKHRYGILVDYFCESLQLCIILESSIFHRNADVTFLKSRGYNVMVITEEEILANAILVANAVHRTVYLHLFEVIRDFSFEGVDRLWWSDGDIHIQLSVEETPELRYQIFKKVRQFAAGALLQIHKKDEEIDGLQRTALQDDEMGQEDGRGNKASEASPSP